jgi:NAD(P)H-flavin reductase
MTGYRTGTALRERPAPPNPDVMLPRLFVVEQRRQETHDVWTLQLRAKDDGPVGFEPGQFTMLHAFGIGEVPISISGDPAATRTLQQTIRGAGAVSSALASAAPGTTLGVRGPFGTGWDIGSGEGGDVLVIAGGIGLAPLRPVLLQLCDDRDAYRNVTLLYGARSAEDLLYVDEIERWRDRHDIDVHLSVDRGSPSWHGRVGVVTQLIDRIRLDQAHTLALVCGPEVMMRYVALALLDRGLNPARMRMSMERNMKCGVGLCGHCQLREFFVCLEGPVLPWSRLAPLLSRREI